MLKRHRGRFSERNLIGEQNFQYKEIKLRNKIIVFVENYKIKKWGTKKFWEQKFREQGKEKKKKTKEC